LFFNGNGELNSYERRRDFVSISALKSREKRAMMYFFLVTIQLAKKASGGEDG